MIKLKGILVKFAIDCTDFKLTNLFSIVPLYFSVYTLLLPFRNWRFLLSVFVFN